MSALAVLSEGEEEVELSLGLSIGGCFRKLHKAATATATATGTDVPSVPATAATGAGEDVFHKALSVSSPRSSEMDLECQGAEHQQLARSDASTLVDAESSAADDLFKRKKELHALRRQEARKKRDEKQQKRGLGRRNGFLANGHTPPAAGNDRHLLEAQELQCRLRDRAVKEIEASWADRVCKKEKDDGCGGMIHTGEQSVSLTLNHNQQPATNPNTTSSSSSSAPFPVMPMQYPFQPVQYMPYSGGLSFPYMMPCWGPPLPPPTSTGDGLPADKNIFQPVALRPFQSHAPAHNANLLPGDTDRNCGNGASSVSQGSSASLVSDSQSASLQGGSCSETKSYRSRSPAEQNDCHVSLTPNAKAQCEYGDSAAQNDSLQTEAGTDKSPGSKTSRGRPEEATAVPLTSSPPPKSSPCKGSKPASPPRAAPEGVKEPPRTALLPQMPCVSTTGNGPNGKTIMGFLYRYTKSEVSIVCVCHGTSFSPAEFVKHAGGTDVSQPLKHIIVVPSAFG
ncbi:hypothetical protein H6P81_012202 [Aristolochia fimbriata]|uniref:Ninja-family protein n=1 Tax=Aristolochia fimbriata TaxID=158543 RepID=A0AAV7EBI7_ARIFI|nr:hypothetical protein H6P81_012202 [Aristolochia fimbriata]